MRQPAQMFPPGDFLREEIEYRGWTPSHLAARMKRSVAMVDAILSGEQAITPSVALRLGAALGTSADFWIHLQVAYDGWREWREGRE